NGSEVHGSNEDGSGGAGETNTIKVLTGVSLGSDDVTDIDAVTFSSAASSGLFLTCKKSPELAAEENVTASISVTSSDPRETPVRTLMVFVSPAPPEPSSLDPCTSEPLLLLPSTKISSPPFPI